MPTQPRVTGVILAGGRGRRLGCCDKGLIDINGRHMVSWPAETLKHQVDELIINANRNLEVYEQYADKVVPDSLNGHSGPLAGIASAMRSASHEYVLVVPCDCPLLPINLLKHLMALLKEEGSLACVVHDGERIQPLIGLYHVELAASIEEYLNEGWNRIQGWLASKCRRYSVADLDCVSDIFSDVNTRAQLQAMIPKLAGDNPIRICSD